MSDLCVNVKDYGAKGDGTTDDTAAIKAAISAAGTNTLLFPEGKYVTTETLVQPYGQRWTGVGTGQTLPTQSVGSVIRYKGTGTAIDFSHEICDITIEGNGAASVPQSIGLWSDKSAVKLFNVNVSGFATGISITTLWYVEFNHTSVMTCSTGMVVDYCYNVNLNSCRIYGNNGNGVAGTGIVIKNTSSVQVNGGSIEYFSKAVSIGAACDLVSSGVYYETTADNAGSFGIYAKGANIHISIAGSRVYLTKLTAFVFYDGPDSGGTLVSSGNRFLCETRATPATAYLWSGGRNTVLTVNLEGDTFFAVAPGSANYWSGGLPSVGSVVVDPIGSPTNGGTAGAGRATVSAEVHMTNGFCFWPSAQAPGMTGKESFKGFAYFNTTSNSLQVWDGTKFLTVTAS